MLLRGVGQQARDGQSDQKSIGLRAGAQAKRRRQRVALRRRQPFATVQQSGAQLMQAREGKLHLPFRADCAKDATALGTLAGVLQQGRFADPGLAAQHQAPRCAPSALPPTARSSFAHSARGRPARQSRAEMRGIPSQRQHNSGVSRTRLPRAGARRPPSSPARRARTRSGATTPRDRRVQAPRSRRAGSRRCTSATRRSPPCSARRCWRRCRR